MKGAYVITEPCLYVCTEPRIPRGELKHLICVDVCPVKGIQHEPGKDRMLYIDPEGCISCGACFLECPVEAIYPVEDIPVQWAEYAELNREWFYGDKERVRKRVEEVVPTWLKDNGEAQGLSSDFSRSNTVVHHLANRIDTFRPGRERKQVTVMFADIKDSTELIRDLDPEAA